MRTTSVLHDFRDSMCVSLTEKNKLCMDPNSCHHLFMMDGLLHRPEIVHLQHRIPKSSTALDLALIASSQLHEAGTARSIYAAMLEHGQSVGMVAISSIIAAICWGEGPEVGSVAVQRASREYRSALAC